MSSPHSAHPDANRTKDTPPGSAPDGRSSRTAAATPVRTCTVFAGLSALLLVTVALGWSPLMSLDRAVVNALHDSAVAEPTFTQVNRVLTDWVWDPVTMRLLAAAASVWLWLRRERVLALWVAVTTAVGTALQQGVKALVGRERPQWPDPVDSAHYAAFPSGHAMTAVVTCGLLLWLCRQRGATGRTWAWCLAAAGVSVAGVGFTRLYLGVHWPSDVVGGWLLGVCVVALAVTSYRRVALSRGH
ncbi:phosphatase PAP2 family protein [Streptomyces xantholiticus]|uniref:phosphatase PAP2 family protein n=1 Tax=Streptomyces xantholiticus TaxID=68285 RepID=UPI001678C0F5|nr:phosphatase PAP2 family protein [Streptomyces xantholiticus]GGW37093.1 phosphatase PAP2 family protein [Streptomyces xantholiticus]